MLFRLLGAAPQMQRAVELVEEESTARGSVYVELHARVATAEDRSRLWPRVVAAYGGYANYQQRTEREIPLVILEPRA